LNLATFQVFRDSSLELITIQIINRSFGRTAAQLKILEIVLSILSN